MKKTYIILFICLIVVVVILIFTGIANDKKQKERDEDFNKAYSNIKKQIAARNLLHQQLKMLEKITQPQPLENLPISLN